MALTAKQEAYAQGIASGKGQADSYRAAYDAGKMKDATIYNRAGDLMKNGEVAARIAELKGSVATKQMWTREMSVKALITAYREGKPSEKVSAIKELNLMHGFNAPIKHEINGEITLIERRIVNPRN